MLIVGNRKTKKSDIFKRLDKEESSVQNNDFDSCPSCSAAWRGIYSAKQLEFVHFAMRKTLALYRRDLKFNGSITSSIFQAENSDEDSKDLPQAPPVLNTRIEDNPSHNTSETDQPKAGITNGTPSENLEPTSEEIVVDDLPQENVEFFDGDLLQDGSEFESRSDPEHQVIKDQFRDLTSHDDWEIYLDENLEVELENAENLFEDEDPLENGKIINL